MGTLYKRSGLTGNGATDLDNIDGDDLSDGDYAIVTQAGVLGIYELDADSGLAALSPGVIAPAANPGDKRWIQQRLASDNTTPPGSVMLWLGGYFGGTANSTYQDVLGNTVADANTYLNPEGWYVMDGTELNVAGSAAFNGAGRYLPMATDDRFFMGGTICGAVGGSSLSSHTHPTGSLTLTLNQIPSHRHSINSYTGSDSDAGGYVRSQDYTSPNRGTVTEYAGGGKPHNHGSTGVPTNIENRPSFITGIPIIKVA